MRERGFINIFVIVAIIFSAFVGIWSVKYIERVEREKEFSRNADRLAFEASAFQATSLNAVTLLNDAIAGGDAVAGGIATISTITGIITLIAGGAGFEIIKDGLKASKKILDITNKVHFIQKKLVMLTPYLTYLPYLQFYYGKYSKLRKMKQIYLPLPFLPFSGEDGVTGDSGESDKNYYLKLHLSWNFDRVVKAVAREVVKTVDKKIVEFEEKERRRVRGKVDKFSMRGCNKACHIGGKNICPHSIKKKCREKLGKVGRDITEKFFSLLDEKRLQFKNRVITEINSWKFSRDCVVLGVKIPIPAVLDDDFYRKQKVGTLGIWLNRYSTLAGWLGYSGRVNIPAEITFARAMPVSSADGGTVPLKMDWRGVFVPPDLMEALGGGR